MGVIWYITKILLEYTNFWNIFHFRIQKNNNAKKGKLNGLKRCLLFYIKLVYHTSDKCSLKDPCWWYCIATLWIGNCVRGWKKTLRVWVDAMLAGSVWSIVENVLFWLNTQTPLPPFPSPRSTAPALDNPTPGIHQYTLCKEKRHLWQHSIHPNSSCFSSPHSNGVPQSHKPQDYWGGVSPQSISFHRKGSRKYVAY